MRRMPFTHETTSSISTQGDIRQGAPDGLPTADGGMRETLIRVDTLPIPTAAKHACSSIAWHSCHVPFYKDSCVKRCARSSGDGKYLRIVSGSSSKRA